MADEPVVLYEERDSLGIITLNRPEKMNTLTAAVIQGIADSIDAATASKAVSSVIIRGAGRTFTAGYDLNPRPADRGGARPQPRYGAPDIEHRPGAWDPVRIPANQLALNKMLINQAYENMGLRTTQMFGTFFDGVTRHTEEALRWRESFSEIGFRETISRRDGPFSDYGERERG